MASQYIEVPASAASNGTTGSGAFVLQTSPTLITPILGVAAFTSLTGPLVIGGTAVGSSLSLQSTSGVGAGDFIKFSVGNNGATESLRIISSGFVGIGTSAPAGNLEVSAASSSVNVFATGYGGAGSWISRRANGTAASPTQVLTDDTLGNYGARGYGATTFSGASRASFRMRASENWSDSVQGAYIEMLTTPTGSATAATRLTLSSQGSLVPGSAALATNATDGFVYIQSCAGTPTGVPTAFTGRVATIYDTVNNKLYVYNGAWKSVTLT